MLTKPAKYGSYKKHENDPIYDPEVLLLGASTRRASMALARCTEHPITRETKEPYKVHALPIGYPTTAAICGRVGCEQPALIWLEPAEAKDHAAGKRIFGVKTHSIRVRVGEELISN